MKSQISRREFLKAAATFGMLPWINRIPDSQTSATGASSEQPNIILILFDALSAFNLSLYGYQRETSPNIDRFASKATVYHNHHSAANFTTPSTASLFTSMYPWDHRAVTLTGNILEPVLPYNLFRLLNGKFFQLAFTQNVYADMLLYQFHRYLDQHYPPDSFSLVGNTIYNKLPDEDAIFGLKGFDQFLFRREEAHGSLFLSILNDLNTVLGLRLSESELMELHPHGIPRLANTDVYFLMSQVMDGLFEIINNSPQPFFSYIHLLPPHSPYMPTSQFLDTFDDGWSPQQKKYHKLGTRVPQAKINFFRQRYDEFIANLDFEFGQLLGKLEGQGLLQNSYVILTSDHGEMFERGTHGHSTPLVFEPVIRIPLIISAPGQAERKDVYQLTSNVDILPTLAQFSGLPEPEWSEGVILPGMGSETDIERDIWVLEAKKNHTRGTLDKATIAMIRGQNKLVYYHGYKHYHDKYEFYDLRNDPGELENLYHSHPEAKQMQFELDARYARVSQPVK